VRLFAFRHCTSCLVTSFTPTNKLLETFFDKVEGGMEQEPTFVGWHLQLSTLVALLTCAAQLPCGSSPHGLPPSLESTFRFLQLLLTSLETQSGTPEYHPVTGPKGLSVYQINLLQDVHPVLSIRCNTNISKTYSGLARPCESPSCLYIMEYHGCPLHSTPVCAQIVHEQIGRPDTFYSNYQEE
jgi:hypothetical protein